MTELFTWVKFLINSHVGSDRLSKFKFTNIEKSIVDQSIIGPQNYRAIAKLTRTLNPKT